MHLETFLLRCLFTDFDHCVLLLIEFFAVFVSAIRLTWRLGTQYISLVACALLGSSFFLSVRVGNCDLSLSSFLSSSLLKVMFGYSIFYVSSKIANGILRFCFVNAFAHGPIEQQFV